MGSTRVFVFGVGLTVMAMALSLAGLAFRQSTAPFEPGACWRMFRESGEAPRFVRIANDARNMETCAARLEAVRLMGTPEVEGAYQGFFIFVDEREIVTSRSLHEKRFPVLDVEGRRRIDDAILMLIRAKKSP